jgi:hypothetical protein
MMPTRAELFPNEKCKFYITSNLSISMTRKKFTMNVL